MKEKFIVIKGRNLIPGKQGIEYHICDVVTLDITNITAYHAQRKYVYAKLFETDRKKNPLSFRSDVAHRERHLILDDGTIFAERTSVFDHIPSGIFYGFLPVEVFNN